MRVIITRTSVWGDACPCPGAVKETVTRIDRRTFKSPEEHDRRFPDRPWASEGTNHRTWGDEKRGGIARDFPNDEVVWTMEMSVQELFDFVRRHGHCVISVDDDNEGISLEIYDDYRE